MKNSILLGLICVYIISCNHNRKEELTVRDIEIFENTPAWELVTAVDREDLSAIERILKTDTFLINYQEPTYGTTALIRAIGTEKYNSVKKILDSGANPNIVTRIGSTALFEAISYSWSDTKANENPKFVKLLLDYGANPNITYCSSVIEGQTDPIECGTSPLMHSISRGFDKMKLLVEAGADINYKTKLGRTASIEALLMSDVNAAYYLIVEKKADVSAPFYYYSLTNDTIIEKDKPRYPVDLLLGWVYEVGSDKFKKKMQIVQEFKKQGIDYSERKKNISNLILRKIKKSRPNDWVEYLRTY